MSDTQKFTRTEEMDESEHFWPESEEFRDTGDDTTEFSESENNQRRLFFTMLPFSQHGGWFEFTFQSILKF
jgi:hypothetical protein